MSTAGPPNNTPSTAMILAAGRGTRLRPLTDTMPKPLLEVAGEPLIGRQVRQLKEAGITDVVVNLHHLGHLIEEYLGDGQRYGLRIHYSREAELLETGGGILNALPMLGENPFWLLNGDIFTDFEFQHLPAQLPNGSRMHMVLTPTPEFRQHGDFEFADGWVTERGDAYVYCGIAVLDPSILRSAASQGELPTGAFSLRDFMFANLANRQLSGQVWPGQWTDIGTVAQLQEARDAHHN